MTGKLPALVPPRRHALRVSALAKNTKSPDLVNYCFRKNGRARHFGCILDVPARSSCAKNMPLSLQISLETFSGRRRKLPNKLAHLPSTLAGSPSTLAGPPDALAGPPDSFASLTDSLASPPNSLASPPNSLACPLDRLADPLDSLACPLDSLAGHSKDLLYPPSSHRCPQNSHPNLKKWHTIHILLFIPQTQPRRRAWSGESPQGDSRSRFPQPWTNPGRHFACDRVPHAPLPLQSRRLERIASHCSRHP